MIQLTVQEDATDNGTIRERHLAFGHIFPKEQETSQ